MDVQKVADFYNRTATVYAENLFNELDGKSLDRLLLKRFAEEHQEKYIADMGCGPGQTTRFLSENGVKNIVGIDLSEGMIETAQRLSPNIKFQVGNILHLPYSTATFDGLLAFYAIVHFDENQLKLALSEFFRVLKTGGQLLFSFHIGTEIKAVEELFGVPAKANFYFFELTKTLNLLDKIGFKRVEIVVRHPYADMEYPSERAYITVQK